MPVTVPRPKSKEVQFSGSSENWKQYLSVLDPLAEWKAEFEEWRRQVEQFREGEKTHFFHNPNRTIMGRVHRGWLSALLSQGDRLAVDLLNSGQVEEASEDLKFLDLCLSNLQETMATWHMGADAEKLMRQ